MQGYLEGFVTLVKWAKFEILYLHQRTSQYPSEFIKGMK